MFVYYDPDSDAVTRFRDWEKSWAAGGWTPRILTRRMAMKHPRAKLEPRRLHWHALSVLYPVIPKGGFILCDSMLCRPNDAAGVHEITGVVQVIPYAS